VSACGSLASVMHFATPEASWNVVVGEARNERNHRIAEKKTCAPKGAPDR